ncbi:hypothetical protein NT05LI_2719 [Listeria ivanovii FSL F6-596]|nr:hypothetical protein NT05LI_2719 [Listeria ivanovii FSL F6-596]
MAFLAIESVLYPDYNGSKPDYNGSKKDGLLSFLAQLK